MFRDDAVNKSRVAQGVKEDISLRLAGVLELLDLSQSCVVHGIHNRDLPMSGPQRVRVL